jgi:hypothetical protein
LVDSFMKWILWDILVKNTHDWLFQQSYQTFSTPKTFYFVFMVPFLPLGTLAFFTPRTRHFRCSFFSFLFTYQDYMLSANKQKSEQILEFCFHAFYVPGHLWLSLMVLVYAIYKEPQIPNFSLLWWQGRKI